MGSFNQEIQAIRRDCQDTANLTPSGVVEVTLDLNDVEWLIGWAERSKSLVGDKLENSLFLRPNPTPPGEKPMNDIMERIAEALDRMTRSLKGIEESLEELASEDESNRLQPTDTEDALDRMDKTLSLLAHVIERKTQ